MQQSEGGREISNRERSSRRSLTLVPETAMSNANPYLVSKIKPERGPSDFASRALFVKWIIWLVAFFYPVIAAICFYSSWLVAWVCIGHMPRPMLDDPKSIGGVMDFAYLISMLALLSAPVLTPLCFFSSFSRPTQTTRSRWLERICLPIVYIAICGSIYATIRFDPGRIVEWWFD